MSARLAATLLLALPAYPPAGLLGQAPAAATYVDRYREIMSLAPVAGQVADVHHLVLNRDVGRLTLESGKVYALSTVGGRTVGAVFRGDGRFTLAPAVPAEQAELQRFAGSPAFDAAVSEAILIFSDSTVDQLRGLTFKQDEIPPDIRDHVQDLLHSLKGDHEGSLSSEVIGPLLNGEPTGFFLARVERANGGPVMFQLNPEMSEAVRLYHPVRRSRWGANWAVVTQFPLQRPPPGPASSWMYRQRLDVPAYQIEIQLTSTGGANLDFAARATLALSPREPLGPWILFALHPKLVVDSARWSTGQPAAVFKAKDDDDVWVRAIRQLQPGDSAALTLFYHGDHGGLIDRYGDWFFIDPGAAWYPENQQGNDFATFDLTYHSPSWYPLASVGERTDSGVTGKVLTTHWVTKLPSPHATFNLGLFENYHVQHPGEPF